MNLRLHKRYVGTILVILIFFILFYIIYNKNLKSVNNTTNQGNFKNVITDIEKNFSNIYSYYAKVTINVMSNKTNNQYSMEQYYVNPNIFKIEDKNNNFSIIFDGENLNIKNADNIKKYDNYQYTNPNKYTLNSFLNNYFTNEDSTYVLNDTDVVLTCNSFTNDYTQKEELYVDISSLKPKKHVIYDINKKQVLNIVYDEIVFNNLEKDNILP